MSGSISLVLLLAGAISASAIFFAIDIWIRIFLTQQRSARTSYAAAVLSLWLAGALVATLNPTLGQAIVSVPGLPAGLIFIGTSGTLLAGLVPGIRRAFDDIPWTSLLSIFYWRAVFGALLLAAYAGGRLPAEFAIPAGLGDMAVTMLAILVFGLRSHDGAVPRMPLLLWNVAGLTDLVVSVLVLGATVLRPWAAARGIPGANFTLQAFVVPIFIGLHLHIFGRVWREARQVSRSVALPSKS